MVRDRQQWIDKRHSRLVVLGLGLIALTCCAAQGYFWASGIPCAETDTPVEYRSYLIDVESIGLKRYSDITYEPSGSLFGERADAVHFDRRSFVEDIDIVALEAAGKTRP